VCPSSRVRVWVLCLSAVYIGEHAFQSPQEGHEEQEEIVGGRPGGVYRPPLFSSRREFK